MEAFATRMPVGIRTRLTASHLPVVNSPRLGMCGYTGPAEPPY
jgi:hypothetical protein